MNLKTATDQLRARLGQDCGLRAVLKFDCGADGAIVVDAARRPVSVSNDASLVADCTVTLALDTLGDLLARRIAPMNACWHGRIRVSGDVGVALRLQGII